MSERYQKKPGLTEQELEGELMIFDREADQVHVLNPTSAAVWQCVEEADPRHAIRTRLDRDFDLAGCEDVDGVIDRAIALLLSKGLVIRTTPPPD